MVLVNELWAYLLLYMNCSLCEDIGLCSLIDLKEYQM